MTQTLILMRHAKSSWDDLTLLDHDRPLNSRGRDSAQAMGTWLRTQGHTPDFVLCSTSQRTAETYERLELSAPVRYLEALYHASPDVMLETLRRAPAPCVLMLGHNPGIAEFASRLVSLPPHHPRFDDFPTCATLVAQIRGGSWSDVDWGDALALDFAIPREVMA